MPKSKSTDSCMNNHLETLLVPHGTCLSEAWSAWRSCLLVNNDTHFQGRAGLYGYCSTAIIGLIFVIFPFYSISPVICLFPSYYSPLFVSQHSC